MEMVNNIIVDFIYLIVLLKLFRLALRTCASQPHRRTRRASNQAVDVARVARSESGFLDVDLMASIAIFANNESNPSANLATRARSRLGKAFDESLQLAALVQQLDFVDSADVAAADEDSR